jgi:hypothetical protein
VIRNPPGPSAPASIHRCRCTGALSGDRPWHDDREIDSINSAARVLGEAGWGYVSVLARSRRGVASVGTELSPVHVVRRYLEDIYHRGNVELVRELCADPVTRHEPGATRTLTHQDQIERISADLPQWQPHFTAEVLAGDGEFAVLVWTARGRTADRTLSGIEVFQVQDGRITDVWNTSYSTEPWG